MPSRLFCRVLPGFILFSLAVVQGQLQFSSGNVTGIPVYPKAASFEHDDDHGTVSLTEGAVAQRVAAGAYLSADKPEKVLEFYRQQLKSHGQVVECNGGSSTVVDVQLTDASFADASACRSEDFAANGTQLKVISGGEQRIVVVLPRGSGSEIALVSVKR